MAFEIERLATTEEERHGVWLDYLSGEEVGEPNPERLEVLIGSTNTREYRHALARSQKWTRKRLRHLRRDGFQMDPEEEGKLHAGLYSKFVLLGWRHMARDGEPFDYSEERAAALMFEMPKFLDRIEELVSDRDDFSEDLQEETVKN